MFVTVGTDGFPFQRLVDWADGWAREVGGPASSCLVQHGTARAPVHASGREAVSYPEMRELVARAAVVVTHAGPGTIQLCIEHGKKPIVVPRIPELGEVVDGHQILFARRLQAAGEVEVAESELEFRQTLQAMLADPKAAMAVRSPNRGADAARRFDELVGGLLRRRATG